jgi:CDGSH iron-sulfur domain-containing protein 3
VNYVTKGPKPEIPKNPLQDVYTASSQKDNGVIYDKKPFKVKLEEGKTYSWCLCGRSKSQPLCDGTHKDIYLKITQR